MVPMKLIGLDLGQTQDFTALAVLRRPRKTGNETRNDPLPTYDVPHLQRFPLGTPYPQIVAAVVELLRTPVLRGSMLIVDQTGVGRAVVDMFVDALHGRANGWFCPITITGGIDVTEANGSMRVPKKELVGCLQVLLQTRRLHIAQSLPEAAILVRELETFRVKITEAANETFGAWREGQHDDLVLAVALAAWMGERCLPYEGPVGRPRVHGRARTESW
jgi:hypothetical protein